LKKADMEYMQRAIELATQARGRTSPNPMVGAVIVKDGKIIGEGYHKKAGTPHAEIHALAAAGNEARGATLYVSLEPCCHHGRTPPCTEAIINSGIKRVVIAALDPNPKVAGGGLQRLKEAGIDAEFGLMQEAAIKLTTSGVAFSAATIRSPSFSRSSSSTNISIFPSLMSCIASSIVLNILSPP
jgi:diaminohydroxyphosphoribosylaminopyrimidine deaminase/5-amino-6-(5-phosphoribosylamino)uracil reductase